MLCLIKIGDYTYRVAQDEDFQKQKHIIVGTRIYSNIEKQQSYEAHNFHMALIRFAMYHLDYLPEDFDTARGIIYIDCGYYTPHVRNVRRTDGTYTQEVLRIPKSISYQSANKKKLTELTEKIKNYIASQMGISDHVLEIELKKFRNSGVK